jgi:hypothetical protein
MRQKSISRRVVIGIFCILFFVFTVKRFYDRDYNQLPGLGNESQFREQACRIWPEWNASDRGSLRYDSYKTKEPQLPLVGETRFLGDPHVCLKAESRLDAYRTASTEAHDWSKVQWGENSKLVCFFLADHKRLCPETLCCRQSTSLHRINKY